MVKKVHPGAVKVNPQKRRVSQDPAKRSSKELIMYAKKANYVSYHEEKTKMNLNDGLGS
jgi:hypothetical protein